MCSLGNSAVNDLKSEQVIEVKAIPSGTSETSKVLFDAIIENCEDPLQNVYLVMVDITSANTGKKSGVSKRLEQFLIYHMSRDIHLLEFFFHVNNIYFNHIMHKIERKIGLATMEEPLQNRINNLKKPDSMRLPLRSELPVVPLTPMAKIKFKAKLVWFLKQRQNKDLFRDD